MEHTAPRRCEFCVAWTVCRSSGVGDYPTNIHGSEDCLAVQKAVDYVGGFGMNYFMGGYPTTDEFPNEDAMIKYLDTHKVWMCDTCSDVVVCEIDKGCFWCKCGRCSYLYTKDMIQSSGLKTFKVRGWIR